MFSNLNRRHSTKPYEYRSPVSKKVCDVLSAEMHLFRDYIHSNFIMCGKIWDTFKVVLNAKN